MRILGPQHRHPPQHSTDTYFGRTLRSLNYHTLQKLQSVDLIMFLLLLDILRYNGQWGILLKEAFFLSDQVMQIKCTLIRHTIHNSSLSSSSSFIIHHHYYHHQTSSWPNMVMWVRWGLADKSPRVASYCRPRDLKTNQIFLQSRRSQLDLAFTLHLVWFKRIRLRSVTEASKKLIEWVYAIVPDWFCNSYPIIISRWTEKEILSQL